MRDFRRRLAWRTAELAERIAHRNEGRGLDVGRYAEQLLDLRVAILVYRREAGSDAESTCREHEILHSRIDGGAGGECRPGARVEGDARQDENRRLAQMLR